MRLLLVLAACLLSAHYAAGMSTQPARGQHWKTVFGAEWHHYLHRMSKLSIGDSPISSLMHRQFSYEFLLPPSQLQRGMVHNGGTNHRLRRVLAKLVEGGSTVKVGVVGGSISFGAAANAPNDWFSIVGRYFLSAYPKSKVEMRNGCVPATSSAYTNLCLHLSIEEDVDLVFVEFVANDGTDINDSVGLKTYERLLRKIMNRPSKPAVVLVQLPPPGMAFSDSHPRKLPFYRTLEDTYGTFAQYYDAPWVSMRNAIWSLAQLHGHGMNFTDFYGDNHDFVHPLVPGHKVIADIVVWMLQQSHLQLLTHPLAHIDNLLLEQPIPPPMYSGNYEGNTRLCVQGHALEEVISHSDGFELKNEGSPEKPKWGYIATEEGAVLSLMLNTTRLQADSRPHNVSVLLAYLRSYQHMGAAEIKCARNCKCEPAVVESYHQEHSSTIFMERLSVTQHPRCQLDVRVLAQTQTGEHKFKVSGLMITEYEGTDMKSGGLNKEDYLVQMQSVNNRAVKAGKRLGKGAAAARRRHLQRT